MIFEATVRVKQIVGLIAVWALAITMSGVSLGLSSCAYYRDRVAWSCEKDGHSYEPRYDTDAVTHEDMKAAKEFYYQSERVSALQSARKKVYVRDICKYCGTSVKR